MDLVNTVRKEGSRGGRGDFKWTDVQADQHRENYLGHSLMAPVGRWQKGKDLQWYARNKDDDGAENDGMTEEERARKERQDEIARIKQAEREALNKALGYEVNPEGPLGNNSEASGANAIAVVGNKATDRDTQVERSKKRDRRHRHRDASRDRDRERTSRRNRNRSMSRSRSREARHRDDTRARSRSREGYDRKDRKHRHERDSDHRSRRTGSVDRRRRSQSPPGKDTRHRSFRDHEHRSDSRPSHEKPSSRSTRKEKSYHRRRSRSP